VSSSSTDAPVGAKRHTGPLAWMTRNAVAANLLMAALLLGGLLFLTQVKKEVFPEFALDIVTVVVPYPGASPAEVERGITKVIEENVRGIDGVKTVTSTSSEGAASVVIELQLDTDGDRALADIKAAIDRITSFPKDAERPVVSIASFRREVLSLVLYGDVPEQALRALADGTREQLLHDKHISQAEIGAVRPLEISIEVPRDTLRQYGLTLPQIAAAVRAANVEIPAGGIKTDRGEILLRTAERRDWGREFANITILSRPDGTKLSLGDIARVDDSFRDTDQVSMFNGKRAAMVRVYRIGDETPISVSKAVHEYMAAHQKDLPPGVSYAVWNDRSEIYQQRIDLLMRNAYYGLSLVMLCLGLLLDIRLAFWVTLGIPVSFLGTLLFMPSWGVSINMISLFAFIITLGIVVDDATVVGEAVYHHRSAGKPLLEAAIAGTREVAMPVVFSVLTTLVAFSPLLFVPGIMGKFFRNIPTVVITVLTISLIESLLVLPAHLGHQNPIAGFVRKLLVPALGERLGPFGAIHRAQQRFSRAFERFVERRFVPQLRAVITHRYVTVSAGLALLIATIGYIAGGHIAFTFMPKIEIDVVFAQLQMPYGTPAATTNKQLQRMTESAMAVIDEAGGKEANVRGVFAQLGAANFGGMGHSATPTGGSHIAEVAVFLKPMDERKISARDFAQRWRARLGEIPGADSLKFKFTSGASSEAPISIQPNHDDVATLEAAAAELARKLRAYHGVKDIDDGVALGKRQLDLELTAEARALGITESELASQVRAAFYGAEASRQQRGRDEVRAYVRLPKAERNSLHDLEALTIRTPAGGEIPLAEAAKLRWGRAYTSIKRESGRRVITVEADVEEGKANANKVMADLKEKVLPALMRNHPGLGYDLGGQQKHQAESLASLADGFKLALIVMFAMMAIPFKSYVQPLIIMTAIPFGIVGAVGGHLLMGYDLSLLSAMGVVALSGVVVNDALVLISAINDYRAQGMSAFEAVLTGGGRRFRPILLTSLTTFFGLAPMIFETSMQARFLIPMAISLGFGVLAATFVTLAIVPSLYLILEDVLAAGRQLLGRADQPSGEALATGELAAK